MAIDNPRGFRPAGKNQMMPVQFTVDAAYENSIGIGDVVKAISDGTIERAAAGECNIAWGVVASLRDENGQPLSQTPGSALAYATLYSISNAELFIVQTTGANATSANVGETLDHIDSTPNAQTGESTQEINILTLGVDDDFKIVGKQDKSGNNWGDANMDVIVSFNNAFLKGTASV